MNNIHASRLLLIALAVLLAASSCTQQTAEQQGEPVVRAGNYYLYKSDLQRILPADYSQSDSIAKVNTYIDHWLKNHLTLIKAEENLSKEEKNVQNLLDNYRMKLLIHRYKQKITQNRLDTAVTKQELLNYYNENQKEFLLNGPYFKGVIVKLPFEVDNMQRFKNALRRYNQKDSVFVETFAYKHVRDYSHYQTGWFDFNKLKFEIPLDINNTERFLKYRSYYETSDSLFHYFMKIKDYKMRGDVSPFRILKEDIRNIIINKRKIDLIRKVESQLFDNARNQEQVEYFVER